MSILKTNLEGGKYNTDLPACYVSTVLGKNAPLTVELRNKGSVLERRQLHERLGFSGRLIAAIKQSGETFWLVDARDTEDPSLPIGHAQTARPYEYAVPHPSGVPVSLGPTGIAVIRPDVWTQGNRELSGAMPLMPAEDERASYGVCVSSDESPDAGFQIVLRGDPYSYKHREKTMEVTLFGPGENGEGCLDAEVVEPAPFIERAVARALGSTALDAFLSPR